MKKQYKLKISFIFFSLILTLAKANEQLKVQKSFPWSLAARSHLNALDLKELHLQHALIRTAIQDNNDWKQIFKTLHQTNNKFGGNGYLWLIKQIFKSETNSIKKALINALYTHGDRYRALNSEAIINAISNNLLDSSIYNEIFTDKKFRSQLTSLLNKESLADKKFYDKISSVLTNFLEKVTLPEGNSKVFAKIVAIVGGSAAANLLAPSYKILNLDENLQNDEASLALIVSHIDDGGSQFKLMQSLWKAGYGILPPLSDQVNALFTSYASDDLTRYILGNAGRVREKNVKSAYKFTQSLIIKTIMDDSVQLSESFFHFAKDILSSMKMIDEKLIETGILDLEGASLRSLYLLGKLFQGEVLKQNEPNNNNHAFSRTDHSKIQKIINNIASTCGIKKGMVSMCSYDILTPYVQYNEHLLFIKSEKSDKNSIKISIGNGNSEYIKAVGISLKKDSSDKINLSFFDKQKFNKKISLELGASFEVEGMKFLNDEKCLKIIVKDDVYRMEENDDDLELKLVNEANKKTIKFARDASGREIEFENIVTESKINWCDVNGIKILGRSKYIVMQTHITETPNTAGIEKTGYLSSKNGKVGLEKGEFKAIPDDNIISEANSDAVKLIQNLEDGDHILIGPGSIITSLLPHFAVKEIVQALIDAKKRGVEIIFIMNGTYDNETVGSNLEKIFEFIETTSKHKLEEFTSTMIFTTSPGYAAQKAIDDYINGIMSDYNPIIEEWLEEHLISHNINIDSAEYPSWLTKNNDAIQLLKEKYSTLQGAIDQSMDIEIRQDPSLASIASKKSYGVLTLDKYHENILKKKNINFIRAPLLTTIPLVDRTTGYTKYRAGYSPYQFSMVLQEIIISQLKNLAKTTKLTEEQANKLSMLENINIPSIRKKDFIAQRKAKRQDSLNEIVSSKAIDEPLENINLPKKLKISA